MSFEVEYDKTFFEKKVQKLGVAPQAFEDFVRPVLSEIANAALKVLRFYPTPQSPLPYVWSTNRRAQARARRWWFANYVKGRGRGGRYQRTGQLGLAWRTEETYVQSGRGIEYTLTASNPARGARFVYGVGTQNPSHVATGWRTTDALGRAINQQVDPHAKIMAAWVAFWTG